MQSIVCFIVLVISSSIPSTSCGATSNRIDMDNRIVGGNKINIKEVPYQVAVLVSVDGRFHLLGGGSIIHSSFILTAAHCMVKFPREQLAIRAGSSNWDEGGYLYNVGKIYQHAMFQSDRTKPGVFDYDFSLLMLMGVLRYSDSIRPIQLPLQNGMIPADGDSLVSGWGARDVNDTVYPKELHAVDVKTIKFTKCKELYGQERITERMFCAGATEGGRDACHGELGHLTKLMLK